MHENKTDASVTPQEQFVHPNQTVTHRCILKQLSQRFSSVSPKEKNMAIFQTLANRS